MEYAIDRDNSMDEYQNHSLSEETKQKGAHIVLFHLYEILESLG